jgi:hypothetical protein
MDNPQEIKSLARGNAVAAVALAALALAIVPYVCIRYFAHHEPVPLLHGFALLLALMAAIKTVQETFGLKKTRWFVLLSACVFAAAFLLFTVGSVLVVCVYHPSTPYSFGDYGSIWILSGGFGMLWQNRPASQKPASDTQPEPLSQMERISKIKDCAFIALGLLMLLIGSIDTTNRKPASQPPAPAGNLASRSN